MGIHDVLGLIGVALLLCAYALLQAGRLQADDVRFPAANALGAALILVSLTVDFNLAAVVIELAWLLISVFGIVRILSRRQRA